MKICNTLVGIVLISILSLGAVFGGTTEKDNINLLDSISKTVANYKIVNTLVNGNELETDVPGYIVSEKGKETIYVPVSSIYRSLGAGVSWSEKSKRLTIKQDKKTYLFDIGKNYVTVNGKKIPIQDKKVIKLMRYAGTDRTMVPVSVIASQMGMEFKYQPEIRTINISEALAKVKGMRYNALGKYKEIRISTSTEISTTSYSIDGTEYGAKSKIILEFQNALIQPGTICTMPIKDPEINRIDLINPKKVPPKVRLEIELNTPNGFYTYYDKAKKEQVVQIVNSLKDIQFEKIGDYHVLTLKTGIKPELLVKKLQGKLVLDFKNTKLVYNNGSEGEKSILSSGLINVAYTQFDPQFEYEKGELISRVVLNFADGNQQEKAFVKEIKEGVQIYIEGDPDKGVNYQKVSGSVSQLEFKFAEETFVSKYLNETTSEYTLTIPKTAIALDTIYRDYQDNIIQYLDVNDSLDPANYLVTVKLAPGTVIYDNSDSRMISIAFINKLISDSVNKKTLIVLDAGHGGPDPGTIGKFTGVKEKDLALKAVYELKTELEKNGYEVGLTRTNDSKVQLLQRTDYANEVNADLFISIHYNSVDNTVVNGIEVLYYPDPAGLKYKFAKSLFTQLASATGANPRGVVKRPLLVVPRETKMPSALVEMGFVSNRDEEIKLQNSDYLAVQIKAIVQGVKLYLQNQ